MEKRIAFLTEKVNILKKINMTIDYSILLQNIVFGFFPFYPHAIIAPHFGVLTKMVLTFTLYNV